ncbi:MAG: YdcF family protein [Gemmatimonadaceae bacterium]
MSTSQPVGDGARGAARDSIYGGPESRASTREPPTIWFRAASGAVLGAGTWLILSELGFPHIAGIGTLEILPVAAALGALAGLTRFHAPLVWFGTVSTALLMVVAFTNLIVAPARAMFRTDPLPASADAIVVLSAGVTGDGMLAQQGLDRVLKGIELARSGVAPRIVLTRERKRVRGKWVTTSADQERLVSMAGVEVVTTGVSRSTREEALRVRALALEGQWTRIVLVTSAFHARRACATFEKLELDVSCIPADSRDVAVLTLAEPADRVRAFAMWLYEAAGTARYRMAGWL